MIPSIDCSIYRLWFIDSSAAPFYWLYYWYVNDISTLSVSLLLNFVIKFDLSAISEYSRKPRLLSFPEKDHGTPLNGCTSFPVQVTERLKKEVGTSPM
jgi:hypothetical protein